MPNGFKLNFILPFLFVTFTIYSFGEEVSTLSFKCDFEYLKGKTIVVPENVIGLTDSLILPIVRGVISEGKILIRKAGHIDFNTQLGSIVYYIVY